MAKTTCPISRADFRAKAKPVGITINNVPLQAVVKEFSTGSLGWYLNGKTTIDVGGTPVTVQIGMNLTIVGSKELPQDGGAKEAVAKFESEFPTRERTTTVRTQPWAIFGIIALAIGVAPAAADEKGSVTVEKVEFGGWKDNLRISNGAAELIVTLDVGPRIISYRLADGKNVFKEFKDNLGKTGGDDWVPYGGHRLWVGPEDLTRTYAPDNGPVEYTELESSPPQVRVRPAPDKEYGVQREMTLQLAAKGSQVKVLHRITNIGDKETSLAPWALTMVAPGGIEVIPLPAKKPHPGPPKNAKSPADYAPNQRMSIWPFTDFGDGRWHLGSKYITLRQDAGKGPTKIGLAHKVGWVGYVVHGTLFVKRFDYQDKRRYPDGGVNFETFTNEDMLEVETLGPIVRLAPGKSVEHVERWELIGDVGEIKDEADIDKKVLPKIK